MHENLLDFCLPFCYNNSLLFGEWHMKKYCKKCEEEITPQGRVELGYETCLDCGSEAPVRTVVPFHKSAYMLVTDLNDLKLNPKLQ